MIADRNIYEVKVIEIRAFPSDPVPNINYTLLTKEPLLAQKTFYNRTLNILRDDYKCVLNDYSVESDVIGVIQSQGFVAF
jgi:hypothetical protein